MQFGIVNAIRGEYKTEPGFGEGDLGKRGAVKDKQMEFGQEFWRKVEVLDAQVYFDGERLCDGKTF